MSLPIVAIVGRPNVGKSSLFNALVGRRISIVDPTAGVTRDRVSSIVRVNERYFDLSDTGGMGIQDVDNLTEDIEKQITNALDIADLILFVVDGRSGHVPLDEMVSRRLHQIGKPTILVINKCDTEVLDAEMHDFHAFGWEKQFAVSAEQGRGIPELLREVLRNIHDNRNDRPPEDVSLNIAIVGRRNVGKSTFINCLAQAERVIVSEIAGTTRDSIDVRFERDGKTFVAIDTAGVRNKGSIASDVEFYSMARAERSIRRANIVLHFFDARLRISRVDKQLVQYILDNNTPAIFVVNKWDLAKDQIATEQLADYIRKTFPMLDFVPIAFITAKDGKNVYKLLNLAQHIVKQTRVRVTTGDLNRVIRETLLRNAPSVTSGKLPKIFYATQVGIEPPTFVLFTNGPEFFDAPWRKYLTKSLRSAFPFGEVPIKLEFRARGGTVPGVPVSDEETTLKLAAEMEKQAEKQAARGPLSKPLVKKVKDASGRKKIVKKNPGVWEV